jgi:hypothetical protein
MPRARLTTAAPEGNPDAYVAVNPYNPAVNPYDPAPGAPRPLITEQGLQLHVPVATFGPATPWTFRGANLCAWEAGLRRPLDRFEVAVDPVIGRLAIGVQTQAQADALRNRLLVSYTYGAVDRIGAHPEDTRAPARLEWQGEPVILRTVTTGGLSLQQALANMQNSNQPIVVEIADSRIHDLDLALVPGTVVEAGGPTLLLNRSLIIRAREGQRPIVRLAVPLRFRPTNVASGNPLVQAQYDVVMARLGVRLEGLYLTRNAALVAADPQAPIVARAALNKLEVISSTLDPAGIRRLLDGAREVVRVAVNLRDGYGFVAGTPEGRAFAQTPDIVIQRSITGPLRIDRSYTLTIEDSIIDGGSGPADPAVGAGLALSSAANPANGWGPKTSFTSATFLGRTRVEGLSGCGGIFVHALEVEDKQHGCIKQSYLRANPPPGVQDRLPQHYACVLGPEAHLGFTADAFGAPGYGQLARSADFRIRERGPGDDAMGATRFLQEAHKWRNLQIRFREFMPVGVRPLPIAAT